MVVLKLLCVVGVVDGVIGVDIGVGGVGGDV